MKRVVSYLITVMMVLTMIPLSTIPVSAATGDKYTLNISGSYEYSGPQEMMEYINNLREEQGVVPLTLDAELTDMAMQRAAETAYYFSHTRPDETMCNTINSTRVHGENIAVGRSSAEATYTQWYNSPGHYSNMIHTDYRSIGIGHFYHNGYDFWVQLFSYGDVVETETRTGELDVTASIDIVEKAQSPLKINEGTETADLTAGETLQLKVGTYNEEFTYAYCEFDADSFAWTSSNEAVATVSPDGLVTAVGLGEATITATVGNTSASIKINVSKDLTKAVISGLDDVEYTGSAIVPPLKVTYDNEVLQAGKDYEVTYTNNVNTGTARVTITGINGYTGTLTGTFIILRKNLEESVEMQIDNWNYTSYNSSIECIEENLKVYYEGKQLQLDTDYYIYSAYEYPDEGIVTDFGIMFKGNYSGSVWMRCLDTAYARIPDQVYTGSALEPEFDLYWDSMSYGSSGCKYTKDADYSVEFTNNQEAGTATVKIIPGFRNYGSAELEFRIYKDISQAEVADISDYEYTGSAIRPDVKVAYGNKELQAGTDYQTYFNNNIQAGTATVEIEGLGDFAGSVFKNFEIHKYQWITDKEATEINTGLKHRQCVACEKTKDENTVIEMKQCDHSLTQVPAKPTSCTEPGNVAYYVCSEYGILYSDYAATKKITEEETVIPATGHIHKSVVTEPTCTTDGYTTYTCECGDSYVADKVAAKGHTYGEWKVTTAATCTKEGVETRTCACGDAETRAINKIPHSYETVVTAPTCTTDGYTTYTCACGDSYAADRVAAKGHTYGEWEVTTAATCTKEGVEARMCSCGDAETRSTNKIPHSYESVVTEPTCTTDGYTTYKCACGDSYVTDKVAAKGHTYGEWIVAKEAACETAGSKYKECVCGDKVTESITALEHDKIQHAAQVETCTEKGWDAYETCSRCDYTTYNEIDATGHSVYTNTIIATTEYSGSITEICATCDEELSHKVIAQIGKATIPSAALVYDGKVRKPVVTVRDIDGNKLVKENDYTVVYKNEKGTKVVSPKVVGKYQVVITFTGNYEGTITKTFKINPKGTTISKLTTPAKKQIKVTWKKQGIQTTGYQIRYSTKQNMGGAKIVPVTKVNTTAKTIKQLKSKKKYYVQIRTYKTVNGVKYYSAWSGKKTITTK